MYYKSSNLSVLFFIIYKFILYYKYIDTVIATKSGTVSEIKSYLDNKKPWVAIAWQLLNIIYSIP